MADSGGSHARHGHDLAHRRGARSGAPDPDHRATELVAQRAARLHRDDLVAIARRHDRHAPGARATTA